MRIEMQGQGSESFYKEVVSIAAQYKSLMNRPQAPLPDIFTQLKRYIAICAALTVFLGIIAVMYGLDTIGIIALVLNAALIVFCVYRMISLNRFLDEIRSDRRKTVLVLDMSGAAVEKDGKETVRIRWKETVRKPWSRSGKGNTQKALIPDTKLCFAMVSRSTGKPHW